MLDRIDTCAITMENHEKRYRMWKKGFDDNVTTAISHLKNGNQMKDTVANSNIPDALIGYNDTNASPSAQRCSRTGTFTVRFEHKTTNPSTSSKSKQTVNGNKETAVVNGNKETAVENGKEAPQLEKSDDPGAQHEVEVTIPAIKKVEDEIPSNILERMFLQLEVEFALLTHKLYHQGVRKEQLKRKWTQLCDKILANAIADHGYKVTPSISDSYRTYAQVQYRKVESTNTLNKHILDTVNEVLDTKFKSIEEAFGYEWLKISEAEIKELEDTDDPCGIALLKSFGNKWIACYKRLKTERFQAVRNAVSELKTYANCFSKNLASDICCFEDPQLISYSAKALRSITPEHERVLTGSLAKKFYEIIDTITITMKVKNTKAIQGELEISNRALEYAKEKYENLIYPVIRNARSPGRPEKEHNEIASVIVANFLKVSHFVYTKPWASKFDELKILLKTSFDSLCKRTGVFSKFVMAKYDEPMDQKVKVLQQTMESRIRGLGTKELNQTLLGEFQSTASKIVAEFEKELVCSKDCRTLVILEIRERTVEAIEKVKAKLIPPLLPSSASSGEDDAAPKEFFCPASPIPGPSWRITYPVTSKIPLSEISHSDEVSFLEDTPASQNLSGIGVGLLFSPDGVYVSMHQPPDEAHHTILSPYLFLRQMDDVPVYSEAGGHSSNNSTLQSAFYSIYQFLTDPKLNKIEETFSFPGKNVRLWAEEIIALFFNKLKNQVQELWERDISPYSFAIALPTFVSSGCKRRLKTAMSLVGLQEPILVQTTTAIEISSLKSSSIVKDSYYAIAIYIQETVIDLSLFKVTGSNLTVEAAHGSTTFPGLREELTGMIFMNIESAIQSVVRIAGIEEKIVQSCSCVVDCTALSERPESESSLLLLAWLTEVFRSIFSLETEIMVLPVHSGLLKGLTTISADNNTGVTKPMLFKEVFPYNLELKNITSLGEDKICLISKDDAANEKRVTIQASMLGPKSKPSRIIRRFDGQQFVELQLSMEDKFKKIAPDSSIDINIDDEGLITTHTTFINKAGKSMPSQEVKMITESHYIPSQCIQQAKLRVQDIINASEGGSQKNPDIVPAHAASVSSSDNGSASSPEPPPRKKSKRGKSATYRYRR